MTCSNLLTACCWNWLWLVQTGSCSLLKLAVTSSNWFLLMVETGSNKAKPVVTRCATRKMVQTGSCCWRLAVTSSNWFLLMVETGSNKAKPVVTRCAWQEGWFKLVLADYEDWLWLVQTGCCWLFETGSSKAKPVVTGCAQQGMMAGTSSNWFLLIVETGSD